LGVSLELGDVDTALRVFERGVALLRARGFGDANMLSGLGYAYTLSGRLSEALPLLEEALEVAGSISAMGLGRAVRISRLAEAYLLAGRTDEAFDHARSAVNLSREHKERANEAAGLRVLAETMACGDPLDAKTAGEQYAAGLALAQGLGMRPLIAHCHLGLGKLHARTGKYPEAQEHLRTAAAMYREMGMQSWLERTEAKMIGLA
jgi:tetratricopeptide (TPR) repeat protein